MPLIKLWHAFHDGDALPDLDSLPDPTDPSHLHQPAGQVGG